MIRYYGTFLTDLAWGAGMYKGTQGGWLSRIRLLGPENHMVDVFLKFADECTRLGLATTAATLRRMAQSRAGKFTYGDVQQLEEELHGRLRDELEARICLMIETEKAKFFAEPHLFDTKDVKVSDHFPSAIYDIEEAGKCFALDRYTACVFHLMRVMEVGLRALGASLNDPTLDPKTNPTWGRILNRGDKELAKPANDRSPEWRTKADFFEGAHATLRAVSIAWRNPTMHLEKTYNEERALDIFNAVKGTMRHLATGLREVP
jgi:hypothetical protein